MAENRPIEEMAERISNEIFSLFRWKKPGPTNQDWKCRSDKHIRESSDGSKHRLSTHPADVVFEYFDPYANRYMHILTDLKSYGEKSITQYGVSEMIRSLSMAVDCTSCSDDFQEKYVNNDRPWDCSGLLFIYNHDGEFDREFDHFLSEVPEQSLHNSKGKRLYVMGPSHIEYLYSIAADIRSLASPAGTQNHRFVLPVNYGFYYPHLIQAKASDSFNESATIETLMGPWQLVYYPINKDSVAFGLLIYYRGSGKSTEEFMYLIDYLFRYQLIREDIDIRIRIYQGDPASSIYFSRAAESYAIRWEMLIDVREKLKRISCENLTERIKSYSKLQLGMSHAQN